MKSCNCSFIRELTTTQRMDLPGELPYVNFLQRLWSFTDWPLFDIVHPVQLATAGFYYLHRKDMVECAFCGGVIMNWKPGDDPDSVHKLNFPDCCYYEKKLNLKREPLRFESETTDATELGIQRHRGPQRPEYTTYEKRLQTFEGWPKNLKQTPEMLAAAGFYYGGFEDQVRCFHCDGGLRNWQPTDDVWVEHAQWFSNCSFVNLVRGHEFVKHCIDNRTFDLSVITGIPEENTTRSSAKTVSTSQFNKSNDAIASVADVVETSIASLPTVSQLSESETVMDTVAPLSTVLQPNDVVAVTNAMVEKFLGGAPVQGNVVKVGQSSGSDTCNISYYTTSAMCARCPQFVCFSFINLSAKAAFGIKIDVDRVKRDVKKRLEEVGALHTDVQLTQDVLHHQAMEKDDRVDNCSSNSPTSELNNLFNQITIQTINNSASKNDTHESDAFERNLEKRKLGNESDELTSLREENRKLKEARLCKVCLDHELTIVFLPCGHLATCNNCAPAFANCPLCRLKIRAHVRIFVS